MKKIFLMILMALMVSCLGHEEEPELRSIHQQALEYDLLIEDHHVVHGDIYKCYKWDEGECTSKLYLGFGFVDRDSDTLIGIASSGDTILLDHPIEDEDPSSYFEEWEGDPLPVSDVAFVLDLYNILPPNNMGISLVIRDEGLYQSGIHGTPWDDNITGESQSCPLGRVCESGAIVDSREGADIIDMSGSVCNPGVTYTIIGGEGDDNISGSYCKDYIYGQDGDDWIAGWFGGDIIQGGDGGDFIYGEEDNDEISGQDGHDYLYGGSGNDYIVGGNGMDLLSGGSESGPVCHSISSSDGDDELYGGIGDDYIRGCGGDDYLYGDSGDDDLYGDAGDDEIYDFGGYSIIEGNYGDDYIYATNQTGGFAYGGDEFLYDGNPGDVVVCNCLKSNCGRRTYGSPIGTYIECIQEDSSSGECPSHNCVW